MLTAPAATRNTSISRPLPKGDSPVATAQNTLIWTVFRLREEPDKLTAIIIAFALILTCSFFVFRNVFIGIVGCIVAAGSIKEYLLPLRFTLDDFGAHVKCGLATWLEMPWEQVQSVYRSPSGLKLSPYANPKSNRFEQLRGITLRFPRDLSTEIEEFVAEARVRNAEAAE